MISSMRDCTPAGSVPPGCYAVTQRRRKQRQRTDAIRIMSGKTSSKQRAKRMTGKRDSGKLQRVEKFRQRIRIMPRRRHRVEAAQNVRSLAHPRQ